MTVEVGDKRVEWTDHRGDYLSAEYSEVCGYVELTLTRDRDREAWTFVPREEWREWLQAALAALDALHAWEDSD